MSVGDHARVVGAAPRHRCGNPSALTGDRPCPRPPRHTRRNDESVVVVEWSCHRLSFVTSGRYRFAPMMFLSPKRRRCIGGLAASHRRLPSHIRSGARFAQVGYQLTLGTTRPVFFRPQLPSRHWLAGLNSVSISFHAFGHVGTQIAAISRISLSRLALSRRFGQSGYGGFK